MVSQVSIERLRQIEDEAVEVFNSAEEFRKFLSFVSATSSYRWYNSYICYKAMSKSDKKPGRINTKSGWKKEGYEVKSSATSIEILVPQYKTEFINPDDGSEVDIKTLSSDELAKALEKKFLLKRTYVRNLRNTPVFMECDTENKNGNNKKDENSVVGTSGIRLSSEDAIELLNVLNDREWLKGIALADKDNKFEYDKGLQAENGNATSAIKGSASEISDIEIAEVKKALNKAIMSIINIMRSTNDIEALNIRTYEKTMIVGSVCWVVMKYLGIESRGTESFEFVKNWVAGLNSKEYNDIIKTRCLDQINLIAGQLIRKINRILNIKDSANEEIIDKNYNLSDLLKAAEADFVNNEIHKTRKI